MNKSLSFFAVLLSLTAAVGCSSIETQPSEVLPQVSSDYFVSAEITGKARGETSQATDTRTEDVDLPPEEIDCLSVANECALAFQSLFLKYLQYEENELSIKVEMDYALLINEKGDSFFPVVDDEIKCYDDLKKFFMEYCTDEFAQ